MQQIADWLTSLGLSGRQTGRRYIIGAPKSELKKFAAEIMEPDGWREIQEGVEVKLARRPETGETIVLCRSAAAKRDSWRWPCRGR